MEKSIAKGILKDLASHVRNHGYNVKLVSYDKMNYELEITLSRNAKSIAYIESKPWIGSIKLECCVPMPIDRFIKSSCRLILYDIHYVGTENKWFNVDLQSPNFKSEFLKLLNDAVSTRIERIKTCGKKSSDE